MTLPRVRFTVRRMMIAVAVASLFALGVRWSRRGAMYRTIADRHSDRILAIGGELIRGEYDGKWELHEKRLSYAVEMMRKYYHASRYPFLPVASDPPEPE